LLWLGILSALQVGAAMAQGGWIGELQDGREIVSDPKSNRVLIGSGAAEGRPLRDGVHRLSDGSTVTIRSGVMVPRQPQPQPTPTPTPPPAHGGVAPPPAGASPGSPATRFCDQLVLKTCGMRRDCRQLEPCLLAMQLRDLRGGKDDAGSDNRAWAESQCRDALEDVRAYPACATDPLVSTTACRWLVTNVCSDKARCARAPLCSLARKLREDERGADDQGDAGTLAAVRERCLDLVSRHAFFPPCR
jgi:hypothetical protein